MYEEEFECLLASQIRSAAGQRLEMLKRDKTAEKKLFCEVVRPVLPSTSRLILEHEIVSSSGVKIYIDMFEPVYCWSIESEGFVPHAQNITRERFDFEEMRIRAMSMYGMKFIPFSWDDLDKKPEMCRRYMFELLGRQATVPGRTFEELSVHEREVIRYGLYLNRPIRVRDVLYCTRLKEDTARNVLRSLLEKKIINPCGKGKQRYHEYLLEPKAREHLF